jgi:polysaccharide export outer membrane protein
MLRIYKTGYLILIVILTTLALIHPGLSAQIASAPPTHDPVTATSKTTSGLVQGAAAAGQPQDLRIGIGDLLQITMFGTQDFNADFRVSSSGNISLPPLGLVHVAGMSTSEAEKSIERQLVESGFYREPRVSVFEKEYVTQGVSILGEVKNPGVYPLLADRHLLDLLSQAGGLTPNASKTVSVTHAGQNTPSVFVLSPDPELAATSNPSILTGDTIVVAPAGVVYVIGNVNKPGGYPMTDNQITVLQALALAGGNSPMAALDRAQIVRQVKGARESLPISVKKILDGRNKDIRLQSEDILFIPGSAGKTAATRSIEAILQAAVGVAVYRR